MKKTIMCSLALLSLIVMQAQNQKGNWLVGTSIGSTGYSFGKTESGQVGSTNLSLSDNNSFSFGVYPSVGRYISDNVVIGTYLSIGYYSSNYDNSNNYNTNTSKSKSSYLSLGVGPFGRFYFGGNKGKGMPFAEVNAGISFYPGYKGEYTPSTGTGYTYKYEKYSPWNAGAKFGYEHFINSVIGLQYYVGYTYNKYKYNTAYDYATGTDPTYTYKSSSNNISFGAGLQIHLDCKKDKK
jgi:hypothetical protein